MASKQVNGRSSDAVEEERNMYGHGSETQRDLDKKYPNRPHNHSKTLPFHELYLTLFNPLKDNKKKPSGPVQARMKVGPQGAFRPPHEVRRRLIERFISRWRSKVGDDIYPAFRLIVPEKDRDRGMYGLKETTIGKLLVKVMKIDKNSEDGYSLLHWKLPGIKYSSAMAGDFAGRCFEVISKRPMRTSPGDMTIAEVNVLLDQLSVAQKVENQLPIIREFYNRMNAEELMWLVRMILRQMKVGATERTIFDIWHPDAENLFNISSSLRRVCWELYSLEFSLEGDRRGINLMQCFQPQLASYQMCSWDQMVSKLNLTDADPTFWIEEKLDGERMQLHMRRDESLPGGMQFGFWSRKAKDYTYLYGNGISDEKGALTRYLGDAFHEGVRNIILDGEMITWDIKQDAIAPFGTLKTAALSEQYNPFQDGNRPLYRVFDCLYLNDVDLTKYTLRKRYEALKTSTREVNRRFEIHGHIEARDPSEIDPALRKVIAEASEGLVLKNPRSAYRLNERNDDWLKVKPEYMTEFGEALDCIVIGGYYGSGHRGGRLSSFLCGLRFDQHLVDQGTNPQRCYSFVKVGGGFSADDYAQIRHLTEGKWIDWDPKKPPNDWVMLGGGDKQYERPDVWIKPEDSVVLSIKAASVTATDTFAAKLTLRFPRFKGLRTDKDWKSSLTLREFLNLKAQVEVEQEEKQFKVDNARRKRDSRKRKREIEVQGRMDEVKTSYVGPTTKIFEGLTFFIVTKALKPLKKSTAELEQLVKANGGNTAASENHPQTIVIAERRLVKVASVQKKDHKNIINPSWLIECVEQSERDADRSSLLLPLEPRHLYYTKTVDNGRFNDNVDEYGDSYSRDTNIEELMKLMENMPTNIDEGIDTKDMIEQFDECKQQLDALPSCMFYAVKAHCLGVAPQSRRLLCFADCQIIDDMSDDTITHVIVSKGCEELPRIRMVMSSRKTIPRIVTEDWITESWREQTLLDEERYAPI